MSPDPYPAAPTPPAITVGRPVSGAARPPSLRHDLRGNPGRCNPALVSPVTTVTLVHVAVGGCDVMAQKPAQARAGGSHRVRAGETGPAVRERDDEVTSKRPGPTGRPRTDQGPRCVALGWEAIVFAPQATTRTLGSAASPTLDQVRDAGFTQARVGARHTGCARSKPFTYTTSQRQAVSRRRDRPEMHAPSLPGASSLPTNHRLWVVAFVLILSGFEVGGSIVEVEAAGAVEGGIGGALGPPQRAGTSVAAAASWRAEQDREPSFRCSGSRVW
jgi:hypothetical protein